MTQFPPKPVAPKEFLEKWLPQAFAASTQPPGSEDVDVKLGVKLDGDGGGEWVMHLVKGKMNVSQASREETAFTVVQSVVLLFALVHVLANLAVDITYAWLDPRIRYA